MSATETAAPAVQPETSDVLDVDAASTHSNAWAQPESVGTVTDSDASITKFAKAVLIEIVECVKQYVDPYRYLKHHLLLQPTDQHSKQASLDVRNAFTEHLTTTYKELDDVCYHHNSKLPSITSDEEMGNTTPLCFHISALGYDLECSQKDPLGMKLFEELVELYWIFGFKTANDPLLLSQPEELAHLGLTIAAGSEAVSHPLATASLGYVKGFARSLTIITVLHWCWIKGYDLSMLNPTLYSSVLTVYGHYYPPRRAKWRKV